MDSYNMVTKYPDRWVKNIDDTYSYRTHLLTVNGDLYKVITHDTISATEYFKRELAGTI